MQLLDDNTLCYDLKCGWATANYLSSFSLQMESSDIQASDSLWEAADDANPMSSQELSDMSSDRDDEEDVSKPPSLLPPPPQKNSPNPQHMRT